MGFEFCRELGEGSRGKKEKGKFCGFALLPEEHCQSSITIVVLLFDNCDSCSGSPYLVLAAGDLQPG